MQQPYLINKNTINPQTTLQSRLTHLLKNWPSDPVRPASVSIQTYLQSRISPSSESAKPSQTQRAPISESNVNALTALLEDRFVRRYPLPSRLRRPHTDPEHYDKVVKEFQEAPSRDWFGRLTKRLKGLLRFQ